MHPLSWKASTCEEEDLWTRQQQTLNKRIFKNALKWTIKKNFIRASYSIALFSSDKTLMPVIF